jgi:transposase InsO family protein
MNIRMKDLEQRTLDEMEQFVSSNQKVAFEGGDRQSRYAFVERVLKAHSYSKLQRLQRGVVHRFLRKVTCLSRAQMNRLIRQWKRTKRVKLKPAKRPHYTQRYTQADVKLLAEVDAAHEDLSGPAVRHILKREFEVYGESAFERLAEISASHIYNLRNSAAYRSIRIRVSHTQARQVSIGERRKPDPKGRPGFLRVDTVHQGSHDGQPGVYHINAVDTVTQWQIVGCVETICERDLIPVLEAMLHQFPFRIEGFHCDNGSEFLNHKVAKMLSKLLVEFTKSRAYRSTDNALVEGKNGAVIRKQIGYGPISAEHADEFQKFYTALLNPYLNFHRPCGFATIQTNARGKRKRVYPHQDYQTPFEKLRSLPDWQKCLKPGMTAIQLQRQAQKMSDTEAARQMQKAKLELLARCRTSR